ncbi:MAG TPA: heme ABC exporter ATP-binding protein CcmA [Chloroflexota bacterium]|nr:heme ABC exporter ATP-binding protein CcmA [Chloroflexota bacterium]
MIAARGLTKVFGRTPALRRIDFALAPGERLAVLGPNGAGKTTLLRLLAALERPTSGSVLVDGAEARRSRDRIGFVGHQTLLQPELSALENLAFYGRLYGVAPGRCTALLSELGLGERAHARTSTLSRGQQQRLAIARALLHDPPVLLLDEPDTGLDADGLHLLETLLASGQRTVVFSTHNRPWAAAVATRSLELDGGRAVG